uniref:FAD-binding PCMH-type domain-containing protein n=1 Tax=Zooxanthella nutricula TaxID=1333877 RepID=A0A7S2J429_9DINO
MSAQLRRVLLGGGGLARSAGRRRTAAPAVNACAASGRCSMPLAATASAAVGPWRSGRRGNANAVPPLTAERYPIQRGDFAEVTDEDLAFFKSVLPEADVLVADDAEGGGLEAFNVDWLGTVRGRSRVVLRPRTTEQVSQVMRHCHQRKLAVCPQGGNTGLVGGSVPVFDEVVISTNKMNTIIDIDDYTGIMTCEAGCVLEQVDAKLAEKGLRMPLDLGAKGSCQLGGNVATNAGGLRLLRYGSLHGTVIGAEFVLADGTIVDTLSKMRKDNTGSYLRQLVIGSEGTLGLITKLAIACPPLPKSENVAFLACSSFAAVLNLFKEAKANLGEILSAYEFLDSECVSVLGKWTGVSSPLESEAPFYVLIETAGSDAAHDEEKLHRFLEQTMENGLVDDGTVASEPSKIRAIWDVRERITEALKHDGYVYKYDISLPLPKLYDVVEDTRKRFQGDDGVTRVVGFGHMGDGNLHLNITGPEYKKDVMDSLEPWLWEWTSNVRGSISAEHGIGFKKRDVIGFSKTAEAVELMATLKKTMDPQGILNPYKMVQVPGGP